MDQDSDGFGVVFPDFPGCVSTGKTLSEAKKRAKEALELHLTGMSADGDVIPIESDLGKISEWMQECEGKSHLAWIGVDLPPSKAVRINITIPENILHQIDKQYAGEAAHNHDTFQRYVYDAAALGVHTPQSHNHKRYCEEHGLLNNKVDQVDNIIHVLSPPFFNWIRFNTVLKMSANAAK